MTVYADLRHQPRSRGPARRSSQGTARRRARGRTPRGGPRGGPRCWSSHSQCRPAELDRASRGGVHQGVIAHLEELARARHRDLIASVARAPLIVVLDGIEDPHNVGAILRTADAAGVDGIVRQSRHAAPLDGATAKASAGAVSYVKVADVVNIARALEELKERGLWTVGLAGDASKRYTMSI